MPPDSRARSSRAVTDGGAALPRRLPDHRESRRLHVHLQVDTVEQRTADLAEVGATGHRGARAVAALAPAVAARARVGGEDELEPRREDDVVVRPGDGDDAAFEGRAQRLEHVLVE